MNTLKKIFILCAFLLGFKGISAQGDVIAPLFGFEDNANINDRATFLTVNQVTGESFTIEVLDTFEIDQAPFTIDYDSGILYFAIQDAGSQILNTISVPEIYNTPFETLSPSTFQLQFIEAMEYLRSQNLLITLSNNILQSIEPSTGQSFGQITVNFGNGYDYSTTSMSTNGNGIFIAGTDTILNQAILAINDPYTTIAPTAVPLPMYRELILVSHPNLALVRGIALDTSGVHHLIAIDSFQNIVELGIIETCDNCIFGSGEYFKDGMAIDWENNEMIAVRTEIDNGNTRHYLSTFSMVDASLVRETELDFRLRNLFFDKALADIVFPGDANHDKIVNMEDLLAIGVKYNSLVEPRLNPTTAWIGQIAQNNPDSLVDGVDRKHIDCNGDGQINSLDTDALLENFNSIHNSEKSTNDECAYQLYFSAPDSTFEDAETEFEIILGSPVSIAADVYGISFTIEYNNEFVTENTFTTETFNSWFGSPGLDHINLNYDEHLDGVLHVGITGIDLQNRSGGGAILRGRWTMEDEVIPIIQGSQDISMRINNVVIIDKNENSLDACGSNDTITVYDKLLGITTDLAAKIDIYPIPTKNSINIDIDETLVIEKVELYGVDGKLLKHFSANTHLNLNEFEAGVYILQVYTNSGIAKKKVILE